MLALVANRTGMVKTVKKNGTAYLVAPVTLIVPGILPGSMGPLLYTTEEVLTNVSRWNNTPLVLNHPRNSVGEFVSASTPGTLQASGLGHITNTRAENGKLRADAWFDVEKTKKVDIRVYNSLKAGKQIEISTGLLAEFVPVRNGVHNGRPYTHLVKNMKPDHLAVLPDTVGACGIKDGCGILANRITEAAVTTRTIWEKLGEALGIVDNGVSLVTNELSFEDIEDQLKEQIQTRYAPAAPSASSSSMGMGDMPMSMCYIEDVFPDYVVYEMDGEMFKLGYSVDQGIVKLDGGTPMRVEEVTTYEPVTNAVTKKEGNDSLPASAYAYVPDPMMPSTWKLRIDDAAHVGAAIAAMGPGFRGNKVELPSSAVAGVKAKIRRAWKKFHPDKMMADMPMAIRNVQESDDHTSHSNEVHNTMLTLDQRRGIIAGLISNCNCQVQTPWKGKDEAALNALSDDVLSAYDEMRQSLSPVLNSYDGFTDVQGYRHLYNQNTRQWVVLPPIPVTNANNPLPAPVPAPTQVNGVPVAQPVTNAVTVKPRTLQEWLDVAPPEGKAIWNQFQEELTRQKNSLIETLVGNVQSDSRDRLLAVYNAMGLEQLRVLAEAHAAPEPEPAPVPTVNYLGMGGTPVTRPAQANIEPLLTPVYNFGSRN